MSLLALRDGAVSQDRPIASLSGGVCSRLCTSAGLLLLFAAGCGGGGAAHVPATKTPMPDVPGVGKPFPYTQFVGQDGRVVDLAQRTDKKYSMLVFMRGFPGYVCPFCTAQTAELVKRYPEILSTDTELFIVYPGAAETIPKYLEAVRAYLKSDSSPKLPIPLLMDIDLKAVDAIGIRHQLARPSTFILDATGEVVYAYVGGAPSDRPPLDDILRILKTVHDGQQPSPK